MSVTIQSVRRPHIRIPASSVRTGPISLNIDEDLEANKVKYKYFGYLHTDGSIFSKRYFSEEDLQEARQSPFVEHVVPMFESLPDNAHPEVVKQIEIYKILK